MKGTYYDKSAKCWRVRITINDEKQKHLGTTSDETVANAMFDLFVRLEELQGDHRLHLHKKDIPELYRFIEEHDPIALNNLMQKTKLNISRTEDRE